MSYRALASDLRETPALIARRIDISGGYADQATRIALYSSLVIIYAWFGGMKFTGYE